MVDKIIKWNEKLLTWNGKYIRTQSISTGSSIPSDYIAWWKFDSSLGEMTGNYPMYTSGGTEGYDTGKFADAINSDGNDNFKALALNAIDVSQNFCIAMWIKVRSAGEVNILDTLGPQILCNMGGGAGVQLYCYHRKDGGGSDFVQADTGSEMDDGNWHFLTYEGDGSNHYFTLDNAANGSPLAISGPPAYGTGLKIFDDVAGHGGGNMDGLLDNLRIFNRTLSTAERTSLYEET